MAYKDLRSWIETLEKEGELARVKTKVDWDLEIGGIIQKVFDTGGPALLFENIKDHENTLCRKLFTASLGTYARIALMMGLPRDTSVKTLIDTYMKRAQSPVGSRMVETGPVKENIIKGDAVDLFQFPAPRWHDRDGGRFIGTCDGVVTKDPETGWVNVGLYRRQIHDRNHTGITIIHGQHIWLHWRKYRKLGHKTMPIAMVNAWDPVLPFTTSAPLPPEVCEYEIMGAIRGEPVDLVKCETIDLEVPANAEIVIEGELSLDFDSFRIEGPFGEFHGYYGSIASRKPVITWNCITCRNDPILQGTLEGVPVNESDRMVCITLSSLFWEHVNEKVPGVKGAYLEPSSSTLIIQIDNSYVGQVYQVANAVWGLSFSSQMCKNIIVVDEDIDIFDLNRVAWAFGTRVQPPRDVIQFPGTTVVTDPSVHPEDRIGSAGGTIIQTTRLLIDATKYFGNPRSDVWFGEKFAPVCYPDDETMKLVEKKWSEYGI
ncbi:MAG: UbiD family decarboxylase [Thermodesulfobacteriota bacterium]|nr:UbiD family decarboxylase [Thermodesulfobacteriota bacterium]